MTNTTVNALGAGLDLQSLGLMLEALDDFVTDALSPS